MKNDTLSRVHIIEPHADDALGSAAALCFHPRTEVVVHTISGDGGSRDKINLAETKECKKYIAEHHSYFLQDYDWSLRADRQIPYEDALDTYRQRYPKQQMAELVRIIEKIIGKIAAEGSSVAVPLGIMHPMHMLVSDTVFHVIMEKHVSLKKVWIYVDHPYDLHSLGTEMMRQSVLSAEKRLGKKLVRYDAHRLDQMETGEVLRKVYGDKHHAEFDGAFWNTLCGFYFPKRAGGKRKKLVKLQKLNILMVASQVQPFIKGGGMANVLYALLRNLQNYVNDARILVPWLGEPLEAGELEGRQEFSYCLPNGIPAGCVLEVRKYQGIVYYFLAIKEILTSLDQPIPYALFAEIVLEKVLPGLDYRPDILHCNDWQSGMLPFLLRTKYRKNTFYRKMKILYTIHFYGYQGVCSQRELRNLLQLPENKETNRMLDKIRYLTPDAKKMASIHETELVSFMNAGIYFADCVSTVSKGYAKELKTYPAFKKGPKVLGIRNGISYDLYNPSAEYHYDANTFGKKKAAVKQIFQGKMGLAVDKNIPLVCVVSRLEHIKGIDSIICVLPELLKLSLQIVIMGDGQQKEYYQSSFEKIRMPEKFAYLPFNENMETEIYAASDVVLVPSLSESCGTTQMIAMHYGVVPVVSALSSLKDTVTSLEKEEMEKGVGYLVYPDDSWMLYEVIVKVLADFKNKKKWNYMVWKCMVTDFSWKNKAVKEYVLLYHDMVSKGKNRKRRD